MVAILMEPEYASSVWGKNLYQSLILQLRQKRIAFCEISDFCPADMDAVFLIASNVDWTKATVEQLNRAGYKPILICNQYDHIPGCLYNCVCSDVNASMKELLDVLACRRNFRIALYGVATDSIADLSRANSLFTWRSDLIESMQIFHNEGSLQTCFDHFFEQHTNFDTVICSNDYAAISLVRKLQKVEPEVLSKLTIISCAGTNISEYYRDYIHSLNMNFESYGKAALHIYDFIRKNPFVSGMTINVKWSFEPNTLPDSKKEAVLRAPVVDSAFYGDPEIEEMLIVDRFLTVSDQTDKLIAKLLIAGFTYSDIAEKTFLSEGTVKYRIKRVLDLCGTENKHALINLLKKYLGSIPLN